MNQMNQRNYRDRDEVKQFRHAYVLKTNFDFRALKPYCEQIVFATDGLGDHVDNLRDQLDEKLSDFDAEKDILIPVGSSLVNFLAGAVLQKKLLEKNPDKQVSFAMGIWSEGTYTFWRFHNDSREDSYEIIQ